MLPAQTLPKSPVFGWSSFQRVDVLGIPSVEDLPHTAFTTSGRAAIYQALLQLSLPPNSSLLVPTYHCPTMVAPVLRADHRPVHFGIREDGLPDLQNISPAAAQNARAMIVSHYFGLAQSLREVREWCDARGIALIEDCAHCYFGQAGERPIGAWGDYCTASLSKFFPVPEAGLLGSALHRLTPMDLDRQGLRSEVKAWIDVVETAVRYRQLPGLNRPLAALFNLKRRLRSRGQVQTHTAGESTAAMMESCDMARIACQPLTASKLVRRASSCGRIISLRHRNFELFAQLLAGQPGSNILVQLPSQAVAPYVFPIWVDDADRIYHELRTIGLPVFRWDRIWPGTPRLPHDVGLDWSRHVIQLLCHQDLSEQAIKYIAHTLLTLLKSSGPAQAAFAR